MAQALMTQAPVTWEPGLEMPSEMKFLQALNSVAAGMGAGQMGGHLAQVLASKGAPIFQGLGEAGALFPEGAALPVEPQAAKELMSILPDSQRAYKYNQALSDWHAQNYDFPAVLRDKWAMLKHAGGN